MKVVLTLSLAGILISSFAIGQEMYSPSTAADNQCRVQAKEVALKSYQSCVTETRSVKIEQIRKEYQEKLSALKNEYEAQLKNIKASAAAAPVVATSPAVTAAAAPVATPAVQAPVNKAETLVPTVIEPALQEEPVEQENLTLNEPTITLKPAATKQVQKPTKKVTPAVAQKRAKGEKGVKGIAKTLPAKQKSVETKPASAVVTGTELTKVAPIQESELEKTEISKAPLEIKEPTLDINGTNLQPSDSTLGSAQASDSQTLSQ